MLQADYLPKRLTEPQREAILHRGSPLLIIAGPGAGKTEVISWRVAHLILSGLAQPEKFLVTTFTIKAAQELKDRIQEKLPHINIEPMQVSTIHSFCAELLRRYWYRSPLPPGFRILDEMGQFLFIYAHRKELGLDSFLKGRPHNFFSEVLRLFNLATEELVNPDELEAWCQERQNHCQKDESDLWREQTAIVQGYRRYCELVQKRGLVDFAFLQRHAITLLRENPSILQEVREQYQEILVDEFQDTNAAQGLLLELLAGDGHHLTVVGDDDQSIYRFRGATVKNIRSFPERFPGTRIIHLEHNFRSPDPIVERSLRVIQHNPQRFQKSLFSVRGTGSDVLLIYGLTAQEEASKVVNLLLSLRRTGKVAHYRDVAILLRSVRSYAAPYLEALQAAGIPYHVIGDNSFFQREEIAQLYNLFCFLGATKPWGDRFLRLPLVGLGPTTREALKAFKGNILEADSEEKLRALGIESEQDRQKLLQLTSLKRRVQKSGHSSLTEVFYRLLAATGCVARFEREGNQEALANLGLMSQLVANWDEFGNSRNFYAFQRYLKLCKEGGLEPVSAPPEDAVQVMTIHQAKGLEFPVVVLGAAMDGRLPISRRRERYTIPYEMRASGPPEVSDPHLVDERKLFYVAITRARDLLIIGTADIVKKRGGGPSPFLYEMFGQDLKAVADLSHAYIATVESAKPSLGPRPRHSFSELAYFLQCPMRYKFAVVYGLTPWLDPLQFGANVHRALAVMHRRAKGGDIPSEEEIGDIVEEIWFSGGWAKPEREAEIKKVAVEWLSRYLREHKENLSHVLQVEAPFSFPLGDQVLLGRIDLIKDRGDDQVEIIDFKTLSSEFKDEERFDLQLDIYTLGAEKTRGYHVAQETVHFLADDQLESWPWTKERRERAKEELTYILEQIAQEHFAPRRDYCHNCQEYKGICPYAQV